MNSVCTDASPASLPAFSSASMTTGSFSISVNVSAGFSAVAPNNEIWFKVSVPTASGCCSLKMFAVVFREARPAA